VGKVPSWQVGTREAELFVRRRPGRDAGPGELEARAPLFPTRCQRVGEFSGTDLKRERASAGILPARSGIPAGPSLKAFAPLFRPALSHIPTSRRSPSRVELRTSAPFCLPPCAHESPPPPFGLPPSACSHSAAAQTASKHRPAIKSARVPVFQRLSMRRSAFQLGAILPFSPARRRRRLSKSGW
jgi:hypothetical protein